MTATCPAQDTFTHLRERTDQIADAELDEFWATLAPADIDFMIGEWKGGEFDTGHKANGFMNRLNWFGKTFHSAALDTTSGAPRLLYFYLQRV